ncbi:hypothetical protein [Arachidicoccus terrestris]|uniref:hypothetical protein n=1 Tax=Arachidicoccus terrestris TaxID=2875539 RepID=UPI001CC4187F|nr:hypothetical protein [Arachidicoccus terrestris]UAY55052.1 hypothetical protein K9M52_16710 [Arachidicoccus terrestris]
MKKEIVKNQRTTKRELKKKVPENKDTLDSRKNEEFSFKGDDITHNKKPTKRKK